MKSKHECPNCQLPLIVNQNGAEHIAYCEGQNGWDGCYAEFGDDADDAVANVQRVHDLKKPIEITQATYDAAIAKIELIEDEDQRTELTGQLNKFIIKG